MRNVTKLAGLAELQAMFDPELGPALEGLTKEPGTTHIVVYENRDFWSSALGSRTAVRVGPGCTIRTLEEALRGYLNDLPSQRQYPVAYMEVEGNES